MRSKSLDETGSSHPCSTTERRRSSSEKFSIDDPLAAKGSAQCSVVSVYHANIGGATRSVTVVWSKNMMNHSLSVAVEKGMEGGETGLVVACKIELKPWPFWSKKGFKSLEVDGRRVDVFWDLRSAKFANSPEPTTGYYVAMVCCEEVVLLLGDCKKEAYKRTKSRPSLADAALVSKRENVFGKKCFSTRAKFDERSKEHDIVVENSLSGPSDPEMWISIDGVVLIHISNLQWKFRGNETVLVEHVPVHIFWDVHDWLFATPGTGHALFIFKPVSPDAALPPAADDDGASAVNVLAVEPSRKSPSSNCSLVPEFSFFLYAWRLE